MPNSSKIHSKAAVYTPALRHSAPGPRPAAEPQDGFVGSVEALVSKAPVFSKTAPKGSRALADTALVQAHQQELGSQIARSLGAPVALTAGVAARDPQAAVAFVTRFNEELKLPTETLDKRNALTVSSPAKFLRVNPALFYEDLRGPYAEASRLLDRKAPTITVAGDCHLGNLGTLRGADGKTVWGINDYDMAGKGSPEFDLERMASSILLMGQEARLSEKDTLSLVKHMARAYTEEIATLAKEGEAPVSGLKHKDAWGPVKALIEKESEVSQEHMLKKFAVEGKDGYKLLRNEELKDISPQEDKMIRGFLADYESSQGQTPDLKRPVELLDCAHRTESGGSTYGLNRFYALLQGSDGVPVILEIKQELPSATETSSGDLSKADARKIFKSMQTIGGANNPLMTTATLDGGAYFVREREREKGTVDLTALDLDGWKAVAEQAGQAIARAHGHQSGAALAINKWVGEDQDTLIQRLQDFSRSYAEQTRQDTQAYAKSL